jgi:hypothetical protein
MRACAYCTQLRNTSTGISGNLANKSGTLGSRMRKNLKLAAAVPSYTDRMHVDEFNQSRGDSFLGAGAWCAK